MLAAAAAVLMRRLRVLEVLVVEEMEHMMGLQTTPQDQLIPAVVAAAVAERMLVRQAALAS